MSELKSPNAKCRSLGCQVCVPYYGSYPGMPQSHCTRCGMKTSGASEPCPDFRLPIYPEGDLFYRGLEIALRLFKRLMSPS